MPGLITLRAKLVRLTLSILLAVVGTTLVAMVWMHYQRSRARLAEIQYSIRESIVSKARLTIENHALVLSGLASENAFGAINELIHSAAGKNSDLVYGTFLDETLKPWAFFGPDASGTVPPDDVIARLRLEASDLDPRLLRAREPRLYDQTISELSMPVRHEDELLGWVVYGFSTRRMHDAIAVAARQARTSLLETIGLVLLIGLLAMTVGLSMIRKQAARITSPLAELTEAARKISSGDRSRRVHIDSNDEVQVLGESFNTMVAELDASYRDLESLNATLESKVVARTEELAVRNREMRLVLDTVEQGLIVVDAQGVMAGEHSAAVDRWLGTAAPGARFVELLEPIAPEFAAWFRLGWDMLQEGEFPVEVSLDLLPKRASIRGLELRFRYAPIAANDISAGVLIIADDITEALAREKADAEQREKLHVFSGLMKDAGTFRTFLRESARIVERLSSEADDRTLARLIHTLKGNAGLFGLSVVAELCHAAENDAQESGGRPREEKIAAIARRWREIERIVAELNIPVEAKTTTVEDTLRGLGERAKELARRLGKGDIDVESWTDGPRLSTETWSPFISELAHVVRNAVDHGLETPPERSAAGKNATPKIRLFARQADDRVEIGVADDGRGINWAALAGAAERAGLPHENREDLVAALFADRVSTREEVTEVSGRGIGLAAVKQACEEMQGRIEIDSREGLGTTFLFRFTADHSRRT